MQPWIMSGRAFTLETGRHLSYFRRHSWFYDSMILWIFIQNIVSVFSLNNQVFCKQKLLGWVEVWTSCKNWLKEFNFQLNKLKKKKKHKKEGKMRVLFSWYLFLLLWISVLETLWAVESCSRLPASLSLYVYCDSIIILCPR